MLIQISGCCTTDNFEILCFCIYTPGEAYVYAYTVPSGQFFFFTFSCFQMMHDLRRRDGLIVSHRYKEIIHAQVGL